MKSFSITEAADRGFAENILRKMGYPEELMAGEHPREDFLLVSNKYLIYVVADGVTLIQYIHDKLPYPNPSPAGEVARIFCEALVRAAEERYENFGEQDILKIFKAGNEAVRVYNEEQGRTKEVLDYWHKDFYAATVAFVVVKDGKVYWGSICDSYVMRVGGQDPFVSPGCDSKKEADAPAYTGDATDPKEKACYTWSTMRNGVNKEGKLVGYGVVTGEEAAEKYLNFGSFEVKPGDTVAIFTDGFEDYMRLPEFTSILQNQSENLEKQVRLLAVEKIKVDPQKFGHERSLIVVSI